MNAAAVLTLVASILSVDASTVQVDAGREDGLQPGDWGTIFFEVVAADHTHTVEVGPATVSSVSLSQATLDIPDGLAVKTSHLVRFELPTEREPAPAREIPGGASSSAGEVAETAADPYPTTTDPATAPPATTTLATAASSVDVAARLAAVEQALERSTAIRLALLDGSGSEDVLQGLSDLSTDDLLTRLSLTAEALEPALPGEHAELLERLRIKESQLETARESLSQAETEVQRLESQLETSTEPSTQISPEPEKQRRSGRWKFWRRGKNEADTGESEDAEQ